MSPAATMKSVKTFGKPLRCEIEELPIPTPGDDEVLIKVVAAGTNPKDWKLPEAGLPAQNFGDDMAGYVEAVGKNVTEFKHGDRVAGYHVFLQPWGTFAEYALSPAQTTFHIPAHTSFEEAATIPLAAATALVGLFAPQHLGLPTSVQPTPTGTSTPLLVYGASSAVGAFAVKFAKLSGISPIIGVCGAGASLARRAGCDAIVDYRAGHVVEDIRAALNGQPPTLHAYDAVSEHGSLEHVGAALAPGGKHLIVLPGVDMATACAPHVVPSLVLAADVNKTGADGDLGFAYFRLIAKWLREKRLEGHPVRVVPGGLNGVEAALRELQAGKVSAQKLVVTIADTPGRAYWNS